MERFMLILILPLFFFLSSNPNQTIDGALDKSFTAESYSCMTVNHGCCSEFLMDYGMANGACIFMDVSCVSKASHKDRKISIEESSLINGSLLVLEREVAGYLIVPDGGLTP